MHRIIVLAAVLAIAAPNAGARQSDALTEDEFFQLDRIWSVHLTFTPDQWNAIQPTFDPAQPIGVGYQGISGKRNGRASAVGFDFPWGHANLEIDNQRFRDVAVRYKGNGSFLAGRETGKISFKIDLNQYVKGQKIGRLSTFNLQNGISDPGAMHQALAFRLYRDAGVPAPRTSYARLYVTVPGGYVRKYFGLYTVVENVDDDFLAERFGQAAIALVKPVTRTPFPDLGPVWSQYEQMFDPKTALAEADRTRLMEFCQFVAHARKDEFVQRFSEFVAIEPFARFLAVTVWLANPDSLLDGGQNYYIYLEPATRALHFVPWDEDGAFGQHFLFPPADLQTLPIDAPSRRGENLFIERVLKVPAFMSAYHAALTELTSTLFQPDRLARQVDELAPLLRPAIAEESEALLEMFDKSARGEAFMRPSQVYPTVPIKPFAKARTASVLAQLARQR